jgi:hypothetical protein
MMGYSSLRHHVQTSSGAHPVSCPIKEGEKAVTLGVKLPGRESDHSPPSIAEFKNVWSYTSTPPYVFMAWYLVKQRENFTITFVSTKMGGVHIRDTPKINPCTLTLLIAVTEVVSTLHVSRLICCMRFLSLPWVPYAPNTI